MFHYTREKFVTHTQGKCHMMINTKSHTPEMPKTANTLPEATPKVGTSLFMVPEATDAERQHISAMVASTQWYFKRQPHTRATVG